MKADIHNLRWRLGKMRDQNLQQGAEAAKNDNQLKITEHYARVITLEFVIENLDSIIEKHSLPRTPNP